MYHQQCVVIMRTTVPASRFLLYQQLHDKNRSQNKRTTMESIYNLVPYESVAQEKKPMYRSSGGMKASVPGSTFGKVFPSGYC
jgi:hypothetical protein